VSLEDRLNKDLRANRQIGDKILTRCGDLGVHEMSAADKVENSGRGRCHHVLRNPRSLSEVSKLKRSMQTYEQYDFMDTAHVALDCKACPDRSLFEIT
jgi:hypothetical protein